MYPLIYSYHFCSKSSVNLQLRGAVLSTKLTHNMITVVLDRSASNSAPSRETPLQGRSHKIPLHQKCDATPQTSYWRGAYSKMHAALDSRIKHNTLESAFVVLKSKKQGRTLLLAMFRLFCTFHFVPGFTNTRDSAIYSNPDSSIFQSVYAKLHI